VVDGFQLQQYETTQDFRW